MRGVYNMTHAFIQATGGKGTIVNVVGLSAALVIPGVSAM